jgi:hypothetical protein
METVSTEEFFANVAEKSDGAQLRGDYSKMDAQYVVQQDWDAYTPAEHELWRRLYRRQIELVPGRACQEFIDGLRTLDAADGIPRFDVANAKLQKATGWTLVAVPGLVPDEVFFEHLANRRSRSRFTLDDKWTLERGRAFMTGTQALIRLPMLQRERDLKAGLNTAGYITGYRGSPVTAVDQTAMKAKKHLDAHHVKFHPGHERRPGRHRRLGHPADQSVQGRQVRRRVRHVVRQGPGRRPLRRRLQARQQRRLRQNGGVLVLAGDDHAAKSSSTAHQSDHILNACGIPVLYPSSVQEYIDYGLHAWAMSRYTACGCR